MKELTITIAAPSETGTTTLQYLIYKKLSELGLSFELFLPDEFDTFSEFETAMEKNLDGRIEQMRQRTIKLNVMQINRTLIAV